MTKLNVSEYPPFYQPYVDVLDQKSGILEVLESSLELFEQTLYEIDDAKQQYRYAEGKWTIKEIVQHMIDTERVFVYRALRFVRMDQKGLVGFDENVYVDNCRIDQREFSTLLDEFCLLRRSTILMFQDFSSSDLDLQGKVEDEFISVRALGFICSGHVLHHLKVIKERYL